MCKYLLLKVMKENNMVASIKETFGYRLRKIRLDTHEHLAAVPAAIELKDVACETTALHALSLFNQTFNFSGIEASARARSIVQSRAQTPPLCEGEGSGEKRQHSLVRGRNLGVPIRSQY